MKKYLVIIFLLIVSFVKAEHFLNFNIHKVDVSAYPVVKVIGGVSIEEFYEELFVTGKSLEIYENDDKVYFDVDIIDINYDIKIFTLTYTSDIPKQDIRKYLFKFDNNGFHNGSDGQYITHNNGELTHHKGDYSYVDDTLEDKLLLAYVKDYLNNHKTEEKFIIAKSGLLIREKPTLESKVIGKYLLGTSCQVSVKRFGEILTLKENYFEIKGKFRAVEYKGKKGYVFDGYLSSFSFFKKTKFPCELIDIQSHLKNKKYRSTIKTENGYHKVSFSNANTSHSYIFCDIIFDNLDNYTIQEEKNPDIFNNSEYFKFYNEDYEFLIEKTQYYGASFYFKCLK